MGTRTLLLSTFALLAACQVTNPVMLTPSFTTSPALMVRNPVDIAVLPVEDGTSERSVAPITDYMRNKLMAKLLDRMYSPLNSTIVDASLSSESPKNGETVLTPSYLKRVAGKAQADAVLAVRIDRWDEASLLTDHRVRFQLRVAMAGGTDGELLWYGTLAGDVKAGGLGAAPLDRFQMQKSCAEIAMVELLHQLPPRHP
jgi:hypothetical protein